MEEKASREFFPEPAFSVQKENNFPFIFVRYDAKKAKIVIKKYKNDNSQVKKSH